MERPLSVSASNTGIVKLERDVVTLKKSKLFKNFAYDFFLIENISQITFIIKRIVHCNIQLIIKKDSDKFLGTRLYM